MRVSARVNNEKGGGKVKQYQRGDGDSGASNPLSAIPFARLSSLSSFPDGMGLAHSEVAGRGGAVKVVGLWG